MNEFRIIQTQALTNVLPYEIEECQRVWYWPRPLWQPVQERVFGRGSYRMSPRRFQTPNEAQVFTEKLLHEQRFSIQTRWERVYDSARSYALVFFDDGEELSEKLVTAGLCRIHTKGTWMPDGRREFDFETHLRALEKDAKAKKRGAWGRPKPVE